MVYWVAARAAELATEFLKQTLNSSLYLRAVTAFESALPEIGVDDQWIAEADQQYAALLERADADLTTAKTRLSRDGIRVSEHDAYDDDDDDGENICCCLVSDSQRVVCYCRWVLDSYRRATGRWVTCTTATATCSQR